MTNPETIFILGAGASVPYGLPTGAELRADIYTNYANTYREMLDPDHFGGTVIFHADERNEAFHNCQEFAQDFRQSRTPMIDLYLNRKPRLMKQGLRAIVLSILNYETGCHYGEDAKSPNKAWYSWLLQRLIGDYSQPDKLDISSNSLGFITFNYDRTLENFFYETLSRSFGEISEEDIIQEIKSIPIEHVFGKIAPLPWEGENFPLEFRTPLKKISLSTINELTKNIRISYGDRKGTNHDRIKELIHSAKRIIFLGFGFDRNNLHLLGYPDIASFDQTILWTTKGMRPKDMQNIEANYFRVQGKVWMPQVFEEKDCRQLLEEHF